MASLHEQLLDAVVAAVVAAQLEGIDADRVYKSKLPDKAAKQLPCVLVTLEGVRADVHPLTTETDEWVLPVAVLLLSRSDLRDNTDLGKWLGWQQSLIAAFLMQLLPDVASAWHVETTPLDAIAYQRSIGPEYQIQAHSLILLPRCVVARVRPE